MGPETSRLNTPDVTEPLDSIGAKLNKGKDAYNIHKHKLIISFSNTTLLSVSVKTFWKFMHEKETAVMFP